MLPGPKIAAVLLWAIFAAGTAAQAQEPVPDHLLMRFYRDHISVADGDRCAMSPSCSAYAARAVEKHGLLIGWIMACDRLVRCGRDERLRSPAVRIQGCSHIHDPVAANDFWWFDPPEADR